MDGSCADCLWESGSNFHLLNMLLTRCLDQDCRITTEKRSLEAKARRQLPWAIAAQLSLARNGFALGPGATFRSSGGIYLVSNNICSKNFIIFAHLKKISFLPFFFSFIRQMGFSLGSLFMSPAAAECPECSFCLPPKPQV